MSYNVEIQTPEELLEAALMLRKEFNKKAENTESLYNWKNLINKYRRDIRLYNARLEFLKKEEDRVQDKLGFFKKNKTTDHDKTLNKIKNLLNNFEADLKVFEIENVTKTKRIAQAAIDIHARENRRKEHIRGRRMMASQAGKRARDKFVKALFSTPLNRSDVIKLLELERSMDDIHLQVAERGLVEKGVNVAEFYKEIKDAHEASVLLGTGSFFSIGELVTLFLAWPIILPMKALSFTLEGLSRGFRGIEVFFQTLNVYYQEKQIELNVEAKKNLKRKTIGFFQNAIGNMAAGFFLVFARLITGWVAFFSSLIKGLSAYFSNLFDTDNLWKKGKMGKGLGVGFIGIPLGIGLAGVSIFTFGIPIVVAAGVVCLAALIGMFKISLEYKKFKELGEARKNFRLTINEEAALMEYAERNPGTSNLIAANKGVSVTEPEIQRLVDAAQLGSKKFQTVETVSVHLIRSVEHQASSLVSSHVSPASQATRIKMKKRKKNMGSGLRDFSSENSRAKK